MTRMTYCNPKILTAFFEWNLEISGVCISFHPPKTNLQADPFIIWAWPVDLRAICPGSPARLDLILLMQCLDGCLCLDSTMSCVTRISSDGMWRILSGLNLAKTYYRIYTGTEIHWTFFGKQYCPKRRTANVPCVAVNYLSPSPGMGCPSIELSKNAVHSAVHDISAQLVLAKLGGWASQSINIYLIKLVVSPQLEKYAPQNGFNLPPIFGLIP